MLGMRCVVVQCSSRDGLYKMSAHALELGWKEMIGMKGRIWGFVKLEYA